jgi:hypothetical protein
VINLEDFEIVSKLKQFCLLTEKEKRYEEIKNPIFREQVILQILKELAENEQDFDNRKNFIDHIELFKEYQKKGLVALDFFVSPRELRLSFVKFAYGINNFEDRKKYLLSNPFLIDRKSIEYITGLIEREKHLSQRATSRFYRNLLNACRINGIEKAFEEFSLPDQRYFDAVTCLLRGDSIPDFLLFLNYYRKEISSKEIRNVFHYLQAEYEKETLKRKKVKSAWKVISDYQKDKSPIWFWGE